MKDPPDAPEHDTFTNRMPSKGLKTVKDSNIECTSKTIRMPISALAGFDESTEVLTRWMPRESRNLFVTRYEKEIDFNCYYQNDDLFSKLKRMTMLCSSALKIK